MDTISVTYRDNGPSSGWEIERNKGNLSSPVKIARICGGNLGLTLVANALDVLAALALGDLHIAFFSTEHVEDIDKRRDKLVSTLVRMYPARAALWSTLLKDDR